MNTPTKILERNLYQSKEFSFLSILICVLRLSTLWFPSYGSMVPMAWPILLIKNIDFWNQYFGNHKVLSHKTHIKMLRIENSFHWHRFRSKIFCRSFHRVYAYWQVAIAFQEVIIYIFSGYKTFFIYSRKIKKINE